MAGTSSSQGRRTVHVKVSGRVQGVGYRAWVEDIAADLGLDGWVRNCRDGTVEAVFGGEPDVVAEMLRHCRIGPPAARVTGVDLVNEDFAVAPGFQVLPTA